eukprot:Gb_00084 [translate_table: standard]
MVLGMKIYLGIVSACLAAVVAVIFAPAINTFINIVKDGLGTRSVVVADLVVKNGRIYTSDPSLPWAESMAIRNNRILHIGNLTSVERAAAFLPLRIDRWLPEVLSLHRNFLEPMIEAFEAEMGRLDVESVLPSQ